MNKNIKRLSMVAVLSCSLFGSVLPLMAKAESPVTVSEKPETKTLLITAKSHLKGSLVPYDKAIPNTGSIDFHYNGESNGFVDGDVGYLVFTLPKEFQHIAHQSGFKSVISGHFTGPHLLGSSTHQYTSNDFDVYSDRIIFKNPNTFFIGHGKYEADITINYGKLLKKYPEIKIDSNLEGYEFNTGLYFDSAPWDVIKEPIVGDFTATSIVEGPAMIE